MRAWNKKGRVNKHLLWRKLKISSVSSYKYDKHFLGHPSHLHTMAGVWYVFNIHALPLDLVWCLVYHNLSTYTTSHFTSQAMTGQGRRNINQDKEGGIYKETDNLSKSSQFSQAMPLIESYFKYFLTLLKLTNFDQTLSYETSYA